MPSIQKRTNSDGSRSFLAWVRIKPFKPASRSFATQKAAAEWAHTLESELRKRRKTAEARKGSTGLTLKSLIEDFLADPETQRLKYFPNLEQLLGWWVNHCGGERVLAFGSIQLRDARKLLAKGRAPATVNRYLSALRSCWNWGRSARYFPAERIWPTRLFRAEPRERVRCLGEDELAAVLAAAASYAPWLHTAVLISLGTGLRQGELLRLEWKDVDFERKTVAVLIAASARRRIVHLPMPAIEGLRTLCADGAVGPKPIFVDPDGRRASKDYLSVHWKRVRAAAGLVDFKWHDLRHSCASYLAQAGASLAEIGSVLGHSSPALTAKYEHLLAGRPVTGADQLAEKLCSKP
jgi:integrase